MALAFICFLLFLAGGITFSVELQDNLDKQWTSSQSYPNEPEHSCSYWDVLQYLNLTKNNDMYTMTRPVKNSKNGTQVEIEMRIYTILDVREADQTFILYVWLFMDWKNEYIGWNENYFCGITEVAVPREALWMPDITIEEMTEKDKAPPSPFLSVFSDGWVKYRDDKIVMSTCKMHIFYFPFDIQRCSLSFKSILYNDEQLNININGNSTDITKKSLDTIRMQYEWKLLNITAENITGDYFGSNQDVIVYTITMERKSALYIVNFLLPVLFFLCLDFASLLMSNSGEKISFKITVLLAVTVMQLILNEILPFTSSRIPLIVIYCIGIFAMMLLSLLESILVNYVMEIDSSSKEDMTENDSKLKIKNASPIASAYNEMTDETPSTYNEGSSRQLTELFLAVEKVSDELGEMKKTFLGKKSEEKKSGYWTEVAKKIDKIFSIVYVLGALVFLSVIFLKWVVKSFKMKQRGTFEQHGQRFFKEPPPS
ncbi:hypothetical protein CHARACLAT_022537 [Characodon lateralis]|uniref:5-hydroxytryptamine receptor 3A-like n=1 Tax=Characodon lateralis TaxID=208331 RepID=A0ABU7DTZ1_9TELE|nr:hypothetical protein [Characodon lateralis]